MFRLQTALNAKGRRVKINQMQTWSEVQKWMVTKYMIMENNAVLLETYKTEEAVKALAEMLGGG